MAWYLDNVSERNEESPYTFYVPSSQVIDQLKAGDLVKLIFVTETEVDGYCGERMWVTITQRKGDRFTGKLDNEPYYLKKLKCGQEISFRKEHICDTEYDDPAARDWDYYFDTKVIVSNDVLEKKEFNFLLRDNPKEGQDSGWSILTGYEDGEYLNESQNFQIISIGVVLNIDDSILEFIDDAPLCAYERSEEGIFHKIHDYDWDAYLNG